MQQVDVFCQNASLYGDQAQASKTADVSAPADTEASATTTDDSTADDNEAEETGYRYRDRGDGGKHCCR